MLEVTPYTIRHTVATEMRKRGVATWEVAGFLGHSSGYKTTERYAQFAPDHISQAVRAIDAYFGELRASEGAKVVGTTGIEPVTPTMSRSKKDKKNNS
jgi:hypothetical protein